MELFQQDISELRKTASALAEIARPIALRYFRSTDLDIHNKLEEGFDPVTRADREIEQAMHLYLSEYRPEDGILGEELETKPSQNGLTWVLDPIDGTRGFMSGTPTWGVLIALNDGKAPVLGLIDQPFTKERFEGGPNGAVHHSADGQQAIQVSNTTLLEEAVLFSTYPEIGSDQEKQAFQRVANQVRLTRYGLDCYAYGLLAMGQIDIVIEAGLKPFDIQGPMAVVEAAGGVVTNWQGGTAQNGGQVIAAATAELHEAALAILNG